MIPAASGNGFTETAFVETAPSPQSFLPRTVMSPETAELAYETVMLFVVLDPVAPSGSIQTYDVAFSMAGTV